MRGVIEMYTEEYERRTFPVRDFLLKIILIILFIFLLVWLIPKFTAPSTSKVQDLSPLTSQIFADNLKRMQDAATSYYTDERLPKNVGDSDQMTLRDMISKKLVVPFVDKNGQACSVDDSYVKITKMDEEYLMKVNLKCSDKEDYILVHMGCYTYCEKDICEKKETEVVKQASTPSTNTNKGGSGSTTKPTPTPNPSTPGETPSTPVDPTPTPTPTPTPEPGKEYEYKKTSGAKMSEWSAWSTWAKNTNGYQALDCNDKDPDCVKKIQLFERKEQIGTYQKAYVKERQEQRQYGSYQEVACASFNYVRINETTYQTTSNYGVVTTITSSTQGSVGSWVYAGSVSTLVPPASSAGEKYVYQGANFECNGCSGSPKFTYGKYVYQGGLTNVSTSSTSTEQLLSSNTVKSTNTSIRTTCANQTTKTIPVYRTITVYDKAYREEPYYGTVTYYSQKTRKVLEQGKTTTQWSSSPNDKALISQGYYYTGNSRNK